MKTKLLTLGALFCAAISFAQVPVRGLVGYYPFNGNALDMSGIGNNGTAFNVTSTADRLGKTNNAFSFNGTSSYVNLGTPSSLKMRDSISISLWFYVNSTLPRLQNIISDHSTNQNSVGPGKIIRLFGANLECIIAGIYSGTPAATYVQTPITASTWYHVVMTYDKKKLKLYLNNTLKASLDYTGQMSANPNDLLIGKSGFANELFNGVIDQVRIYQTALRPDEIKALYEEQQVEIKVAKSTYLCKGGKEVLRATKGLFSYKWSNGIEGVDSLVVTSPGSYFVVTSSGTSNTLEILSDVTQAQITGLEKFVNWYAKPIAVNALPVGGILYGNGISNGSFDPKVAGLGTSIVHFDYSSQTGCSGTLYEKVIVYDTLSATCKVDDTLYITTTTTSLNGTSLQNTLKVFPNPTSTSLEITSSDYSIMSGFSLEIVNTLGQSTFSSLINKSQFSISVSSWKKGIYVLRLLNNLGEVVDNRKIVVE